MKKLIPHPRSTHVEYFPWTKNEKYKKMLIEIMFFNVFLIFRVAGFIKIMQHGYSLDEELNFASNEYAHSKFE